MIRYRRNSRLFENRISHRTYRSRRLYEGMEPIQLGDPTPDGWKKYQVVKTECIEDDEDWDDWNLKEYPTGEYYVISSDASDDEIIDVLHRDGWLDERWVQKYKTYGSKPYSNIRVNRGFYITFPYSAAGYFDVCLAPVR